MTGFARQFVGVWHEVPNVRVGRRKDVSPGKLGPVFCCSPNTRIHSDSRPNSKSCPTSGFDDEKHFMMGEKKRIGNSVAC